MSPRPKYAHLADGTRVRVKHTPFPVHASDMPSNPREGDTVQTREWRRFRPLRPSKLITRTYIVRKGGDGRLWLVRLRKVETLSPT